MQSETGTGKTLAYLLPLFEKLKDSSPEIKAVILAPTHELVIQIQRQMERLSQNSAVPILSTPFIGGANIKRQIDKLKKKPHIIVGSPGRILELLMLKKIKAQTIETVIIDEADQLLDINNAEIVLKIIKCLPKERQLIIASATLPKNTVETAKTIMTNPVQIKSEKGQQIPESISHIYLGSEQRDKIDLLKRLIKNINPRKALVFLNNVNQIDNLVEKLQYNGIQAEDLHGTNQKLDRKQVMEISSRF